MIDIKAFMFDFNGVIIDDEDLHYELFAEAAAPHGITLTREVYDEKYIGYDDRDGLGTIFRDNGIDKTEDEIQKHIDDKAVRYMELVESRGRLFEGWADFVRAAAPYFRLGICTGALRAEAERVLEITGTTDLITALVAAEDVQAGKPDPEGYNKLCEALSQQALADGDPPLVTAQTIVFEDTTWGLRSAKAAGAWRVGFLSDHSDDEFRSLCHVTIDGWQSTEPFDLIRQLQEVAENEA